MLRKIRITLATLMLIGITLLFLDFTGTMHHWVSWMPKLQFLEAVLALNVVVIVALLVLTLVFGRIYCSVICPMGIMQDIFGWLGKKAKKNRYTYSKQKHALRIIFFVMMLISLVLGGGTIVQLLAPYSAFGRICTNLLQPVWMAGNNLLAAIAEHYDSYAFYHTNIWMRALPSLIIAAITLIILAVLAWRNGRTYCNTICPVGTLLSVFAKFSWLKIHFDVDKCKNCSLCTKNCKAACIDYKTHTVDPLRCVVCGDCIKSCKFGALKYTHGANRTNGTNETNGANETIDTSKRSFLLSSALLATAAMAQNKDKIMDGGLAEIEDKVAPERQLCISECPNEVLRPSADLWHLMQPTMSYERGYCRPECNRCSEVCPAGAIKPLAHDLKASTQIGHAVWIKKNCIPLTDGVECGNCARHCPVGAIEMVPSDPDDEESPYVPAVNENRCIGCGACEYLCPARPFSAIYVEGHEQHKEV